MISKLKLRLTLLFSVLTSLVFICMTILTCQLSLEQYQTNMNSLFQSESSTLKEYLTSSSILRDSWLSEQEMNTSSIIYIEDGANPLHFSGVFITGQKRADLITLAKETQASTFVDEDGNPYLCSQMKIRRPNDTTLTLWMIKDYMQVQKHLQQTTLTYTLIGLGGCIILSALCFFMVCMATRPIKESIQRQNEFVAAASHELRSPLTVMKASLYAASTEDDPATHAKLLDNAIRETDRLKSLTDDLLILTGNDADTMRLNLSTFGPDTMLIEVYESFAPLCKQRNHAFSLILPEEELPNITADATRIAQLLGTFIHNALDYSGDETPIQLKAYRHRNGVAIEVIDHGPGISKEDKKKIFRRFYRSDRSRTDKSHFGLGLSVAEQIAREHRAEISVLDTPGGGATFRILL